MTRTHVMVLVIVGLLILAAGGRFGASTLSGSALEARIKDDINDRAGRYVTASVSCSPYDESNEDYPTYYCTLLDVGGAQTGLMVMVHNDEWGRPADFARP